MNVYRILDTSHTLRELILRIDEYYRQMDGEPQRAAIGVHHIDDETIMFSIGTNSDSVEAGVLDVLRRNSRLKVKRVPSPYAPEPDKDWHKPEWMTAADWNFIQDICRMADDPCMNVIIKIADEELGNTNILRELGNVVF